MRSTALVKRQHLSRFLRKLASLLPPSTLHCPARLHSLGWSELKGEPGLRVMFLDSSAHNTALESWKSLHMPINKCLFLEEREQCTSLSLQQEGPDRSVTGTNKGKDEKLRLAPSAGRPSIFPFYRHSSRTMFEGISNGWRSHLPRFLIGILKTCPTVSEWWISLVFKRDGRM